MAGVSSLSLSQGMRLSLARMQTELTRSQKESSTWRVADVGLALGGNAKQSISLNRDLARIEGIKDTNALATARLTATQGALTDLGSSAQDFLSALSASQGSNNDPAILQVSGANTLEALTTLLNSSINGEYVFGGTNTGAKPLNDWTASGSSAKQAFDDAFAAYFSFPQSDPQAAGISEAGMNGFLDAVEDQFLGSGWSANWSNATDGGMDGRIALNETAQTSVSGNDMSLRKLTMAAAVLSDLFSADVGAAARKAVVGRATALVGDAVGGLAGLQARTGLMQARVSNATERLAAQADLFDTHIQALEGVDPYEASVRVSSLMQQIETSYALTARIQQLSLAQFLN